MIPLPASAWRYLGDRPGEGEVVPVDGVGLGPLLLVGDSAAPGGVRCLPNVCTHRGAALLTEPARGRGRLRCPYHGRCFATDGRLLSAPGFEDLPDEPLVELSVGAYGSAVFGAHDPERAFVDWLPAGLSAPPPRSAGRAYEIDAPWTLYVENFLEGLHVPFAHPGLNAALDHATYRTEVDGHRVLQRCDDVRWWFLFPSTMLNIYGWGGSLNAIEPMKGGWNRVRYVTYGEPTPDWGVDLHQTEMEDQALVESVARGVASPFFHPGALSPRWESGVAAFRRLLAELPVV